MSDNKEQEGNFTDEDYQFLLGDIEEAIAEGNRKYGYGELGYIGVDGYFYPLPEGVILSEPKAKPNPKRFRLKSKSKLRQRRPQIHYHRVRVRAKHRPMVKEFRI